MTGQELVNWLVAAGALDAEVVLMDATGEEWLLTDESVRSKGWHGEDQFTVLIERRAKP